MGKNAELLVSGNARQDKRASALTAIEFERRPALATVVADRIRDAIVFGELALGEAISEERLAAKFGVSRTPVREALSLLQLQGLVDVRPQRGSFVFQPSEADIAALCQFRAMVETGALKLAFANDRVGMLAALQAAEDAMLQAEAANDWVAAARADADFHAAILRHCGNLVFAQAYDLIAGRIGAARFFARKSSRSKRGTGAEHRAIIKAFARGDVDGAMSALTDHIAAMPKRFADAQKSAATQPVPSDIKANNAK